LFAKAKNPWNGLGDSQAQSIPAPLLWGVAAGFASLIPMVGSALVWVPAAAVLAIQGSWGWAVFMVAWGVILVTNSDNIVRPWVVGAQLPVSGLALFIAMLGGVAAFGLIGLLLGPVALALAVTLFRFAREEFGDYGE
jgi:predicted PurR-regulated permease PerM